MNDQIIYCNIEKLTLSSFEAIFFQPKNWNIYAGENKYPYYGWWSPKNSVTYFTGKLSDHIDLVWINSEINDELKEYDFKLELKEYLNEESQYYGSTLVHFNNKIYYDIEFLIKFIWDDGDPSVGIQSGYIPQLVLNNNKPVYRLYQAL